MTRTASDARAAYERARDHVRVLEVALADLPAAYKKAVTAGDARAMKAARLAKIDHEEELLVARIVVVRAEIATLDAELTGVAAREPEVTRAVTAAFAETKACQAALEAAMRVSNIVQGDAAVLRGQREDLVGRKMDVQDQLRRLSAFELPE